MIDFVVDESRCTKCGQCVRDCPLKIIEMDGGVPFVKEDNEAKCMGCQHCLAICPTAALGIFGIDPKECVSIKDVPGADGVEALIRTRRTVRQFKKVNVDKEKLDRLLKVAANAPTGKNQHTVQYNIIDDIEQMTLFKEKVISLIERMDAEGKMQGELQFFVTCARAYRGGSDIIFRGAPHMVVASVTPETLCKDADGIISMSYLELMASSMGIGSVWLGFMMHIFMFAPEVKELLGIPAENHVSYAMLLGDPAIRYHRGVVRDDAVVKRVTFAD